jgi:sulfate adenylyltransferase subunit 1
MNTNTAVRPELVEGLTGASASTARTDTATALKFITCGSVDDGKSTLIGRLLVDTRAVLQDHLAGVQRQGQTDLALLTDGLSAEREQGITIDVAWRYFNTPDRKFIIGDAPGHEQYTRNMVTAASNADAAVVLVDATKLDWTNPSLALLPQTRRHSLLLKLLRVPSVVFAINKLDAVANAAQAFAHIRAALHVFAGSADLAVAAVVPVSALKGWNVVDAAQQDGWCGYQGPTLLQILEQMPVTAAAGIDAPPAFSVQWVEKSASSSSDTRQGRRVFWGRVAAGAVRPGATVSVFPSGQSAKVTQVLNHVRQSGTVAAGRSAGIVLDRELDVSRGDWLLGAESNQAGLTSSLTLQATVAWLDDQPLTVGRVYWALHGHRWVKARIRRIVHRLNIHTLSEEDASELDANAIGQVDLVLQHAIITQPYGHSRVLGAMILVDTASHKTAGAAFLN